MARQQADAARKQELETLHQQQTQQLLQRQIQAQQQLAAKLRNKDVRKARANAQTMTTNRFLFRHAPGVGPATLQRPGVDPAVVLRDIVARIRILNVSRLASALGGGPGDVAALHSDVQRTGIPFAPLFPGVRLSLDQ